MVRPCHLYSDQRGWDAHLTRHVLHDNGGNFAGVLWKTTRKLKELEQDRKTQPRHFRPVV
jgi:hypothetical protein